MLEQFNKKGMAEAFIVDLMVLAVVAGFLWTFNLFPWVGMKQYKHHAERPHHEDAGIVLNDQKHEIRRNSEAIQRVAVFMEKLELRMDLEEQWYRELSEKVTSVGVKLDAALHKEKPKT